MQTKKLIDLGLPRFFFANRYPYLKLNPKIKYLNIPHSIFFGEIQYNKTKILLTAMTFLVVVLTVGGRQGKGSIFSRDGLVSMPVNHL